MRTHLVRAGTGDEAEVERSGRVHRPGLPIQRPSGTDIDLLAAEHQSDPPVAEHLPSHAEHACVPVHGGSDITAIEHHMVDAVDGERHRKNATRGRAACDALPDGGAFIVVEHLIDDARRDNVFGLMMSLNMLIHFGDAFDFTGSDFAGWCRDAGFGDIEILPLSGLASAGIAYK
jgi:hypothetical protein